MIFQKPFGTHRSVDIDFTGQHSLTLQSSKDECDINYIMARYQTTGLIDHVNDHSGDYGDFMSAADYHTSMNEVIAAQESFNTLPSSIRKHFNNSPSEFLDFVQNPDNIDQMREMGLAHPIDVDSSTKVEEIIEKKPVEDRPPASST